MWTLESARSAMILGQPWCLTLHKYTPQNLLWVWCASGLARYNTVKVQCGHISSGIYLTKHTKHLRSWWHIEEDVPTLLIGGFKYTNSSGFMASMTIPEPHSVRLAYPYDKVHSVQRVKTGEWYVFNEEGQFLMQLTFQGVKTLLLMKPDLIVKGL